MQRSLNRFKSLTLVAILAATGQSLVVSEAAFAQRQFRPDRGCTDPECGQTVVDPAIAAGVNQDAPRRAAPSNILERTRLQAQASCVLGAMTRQQRTAAGFVSIADAGARETNTRETALRNACTTEANQQVSAMNAAQRTQLLNNAFCIFEPRHRDCAVADYRNFDQALVEAQADPITNVQGGTVAATPEGNIEMTPRGPIVRPSSIDRPSEATEARASGAGGGLQERNPVRIAPPVGRDSEYQGTGDASGGSSVRRHANGHEVSFRDELVEGEIQRTNRTIRPSPLEASGACIDRFLAVTRPYRSSVQSAETDSSDAQLQAESAAMFRRALHEYYSCENSCLTEADRNFLIECNGGVEGLTNGSNACTPARQQAAIDRGEFHEYTRNAENQCVASVDSETVETQKSLRFVFLLDNSPSMRGPGFRAAGAIMPSLLNTVQALPYPKSVQVTSHALDGAGRSVVLSATNNPQFAGQFNVALQTVFSLQGSPDEQYAQALINNFDQLMERGDDLVVIVLRDEADGTPASVTQSALQALRTRLGGRLQVNVVNFNTTTGSNNEAVQATLGADGLSTLARQSSGISVLGSSTVAASLSQAVAAFTQVRTDRTFSLAQRNANRIISVGMRVGGTDGAARDLTPAEYAFNAETRELTIRGSVVDTYDARTFIVRYGRDGAPQAATVAAQSTPLREDSVRRAEIASRMAAVNSSNFAEFVNWANTNSESVGQANESITRRLFRFLRTEGVDHPTGTEVVERTDEVNHTELREAGLLTQTLSEARFAQIESLMNAAPAGSAERTALTHLFRTHQLVATFASAQGDQRTAACESFRLERATINQNIAAIADSSRFLKAVKEAASSRMLFEVSAATANCPRPAAR